MRQSDNRNGGVRSPGHRPQGPNRRSGIKVVVWIAVIGLALLALGTAAWVRRFHRYTPAEVVQDLRAGVAARHAPRPVERFLELRYGPLTEATNRQKAFLDFFNVGHIEGLQIITRRMVPPQRQSNVTAMAQWIADYRQGLSPEEKASLAGYLQSEDGRLTLKRATAQYLSQDVHYRAATASVIKELMTTLAEVQKP
jgi:hypothetical protein